MEGPFDIPSHWAWTSVGEVCQLSSGGTPRREKSEYWNGDIPWVKISDIPEDGKVLETEEKISKLGLDNSSAKLFPAGTLLFTIFATIGKTGILGIDAATNQAICGITPKEGVDRNFVFYFLRYFGWSLRRKTHGITQENINMTILKALPFPLPPLAEQQRIVGRIEGMFQEITATRRALHTVAHLLKQFRASLLYEEYDNREVKQLSEVAHVFNGRAVGSGVSEIRVFKTRHVYPSGLKMDNPSYLKLEQEKHIGPDRFLRDGDVLIVNTWQNLGRVCYVDKPQSRWTVDTQITVVRPKKGNVGKFIFYFLLSKRGYGLLLGCERGALTAGQSRKLTHIYPKDVGNIMIPHISSDQQASVVKRIDLGLNYVSATETSLELARNYVDSLEQSVLHKAFRGELVPQDPNDEPASVLLERLRAQRAVMSKKDRSQKVLEFATTAKISSKT